MSQKIKPENAIRKCHDKNSFFLKDNKTTRATFVAERKRHHVPRENS